MALPAPDFIASLPDKKASVHVNTYLLYIQRSYFETMRHTPNRLPRNDDIHLFSATSTSNRQNDPILDAKLKKRETDRLAQRACRQRQKDRIAYLETLVRELRDGRQSDTETSRSPNEGTCVRSGRKRSTVHKLPLIFQSLIQT